MYKYDGEKVYKFLLFMSVFLAIIIYLGTHNIKSGFINKIIKEDNVEDQGTEAVDLNNFNDTLDISGISQGNLQINLPDGVKESNLSIEKRLIEDKIIINFPKGHEDYDFTQIISNTGVITNLNNSISGDIVNIEINFASVMDCKADYDDGKLNLEFFKPSDITTVPVVVIDPGHGDYDVGATANNVYEKDISLSICNVLYQMLSGENMMVYYTRLDDSYPTVERRADFVNEIMPDLFISVHENSCDNAEVSGTSVLYNKNDTGEFGSMWLSQIMLENVTATCGTNDKGIEPRNDVHIIRSSKVPVALVETGFMSNAEEFKMLNDSNGQIEIARGIYNGIIEALKKMGW